MSKHDGRDDFSDVVSNASNHVREREVAIQEAAERSKPKADAPRLVVALLILAGVVVWDGYALSRPPEEAPVAEQEEDLRWLVTDAVDLIESYRDEDGRLPAPGELTDLLDEEVSYTPQGAGYVVIAETESARVEYDSSVSIADWLAARGLDPTPRGGS